MKKLISYTVIASVLSESLMGCSNKTPMPEIFGQTINDNYYNTEHEGYKVVSETDGNYKKFQNKSLNGGVINISVLKSNNTAVIDKESDLYSDYQSCITAFNEDNKNIQKIITSGQKQNIVDANMAYVQYGKSRIKFTTTPCEELKSESNKDIKYQYKVHVEGLNANETSKVSQGFKDGATVVVMAPFAAVAFIIAIPVVLITWATLKMMGYKGG